MVWNDGVLSGSTGLILIDKKISERDIIMSNC